MLIKERLEELNISMYRLSKECGVPQATISDICTGKADLSKCAAGTLYKIAKKLKLTIEEILESELKEQRSSFETYKSNICHYVKDMGDVEFMIEMLEKDEVRKLYNRRWYPEALYLLAMIDYLSKENDVPICTKYDDIRTQKLEKPIYPVSVIITSEVLKSDEPLKKAKREALPEFKRFNIIESEIRNIV